MTDAEIITSLEKHAALAEVTRKISFEGFHNGSRVTVDIHDRSENVDNPLVRFYVVATREDGTTATGNPAATLEETIPFVHWQNFNTPPRR